MSTEQTALPEPQRIAIAGATGRVGHHLVNLLAPDRVEVVALTRRANDARLPAHVQPAEVAFDRPESLREALRGVDRVFISHGTSPDQMDHEIALIDAAVAVGVRQIVKLSAIGPPTPLAPNAWHLRIEDHLWRQDVAFTLLRPSAFVDVLSLAGGQVAARTWAGAAGSARVNYIEPFDVARVARVALLEEVEATSRRAYHLTGTRSWTMAEVADELSTLLGRPVVYKPISPAERRDALLAAGTPPFKADLLVGLERMFRDRVFGETTHTVRDLTGEEPRPLTAWLGENIGIFGGSKV